MLRASVLLLALALAGCDKQDAGVDMAASSDMARNPSDDMTQPPDSDLSGALSHDLAPAADLRPYLYHVEIVTQPAADFVITYWGDATMIATYDSASFFFTILDTTGNNVGAGINVVLTLPPGWASTNEALATDSNGTGGFTVYAGPLAGSYSIAIAGDSIEPLSINVTSVEPMAPNAPNFILPLVNWTRYAEATDKNALPASAIDRSMLSPFSLAPDSDNGYFVADPEQNRIFYVDKLGVMTFTAGTSILGGDAGDDGLAVDALLSGPWGVALDETNQKLYFLDQTTFVNGHSFAAPIASSKIRVIDLTSGNISRFAGGGNDANASDPLMLQMQARGLAVSATGQVVFADLLSTDRIRSIQGLAVTTLLTAGSCDAGGKFMGCVDPDCNLAFNAAGTILYTAGSFCSNALEQHGAIAAVTLPNTVALLTSGGVLDSGSVYSLAQHNGNLYVASSTIPAIYSMAAQAGSLALLVGNGTSDADYALAGNAQLADEISLAVRSDGKLLFTFDSGVRILW